jgi:hypothetical protein
MAVSVRHTKAVFAATALASLVLWSSLAHAGAWAQEDGGLYMQLSMGAESATQQYKESGETFQLLSEDDEGSFRSLSSFLYAEFGLLPSFTVVAASAYRFVELDSTQVRSTVHGFGDFQFGARYQILEKPLVLSAFVGAKFPTGYTPDPPELRAATLGNGVQEYEARLLAGHSFYPVPIYVSAEVGFRLRGSRATAGESTVDYPPEIPYFLELGWGPTDWLWVRGVVDGVQGTGDPVAIEGISLTPLTQHYTKVGPSLIFSFLDAYQLQLNYAYTLRGVNALKSQQVTLGLAVDTTL